MTDRPASPTDSPRPWWKRRIGFVYFGLIGLCLLAMLVIGLLPPAPRSEGASPAEVAAEKGTPMIPFAIALDLLVLIPSGIWIFRRSLRAPQRPRARSILVGLLLFLPVAAAVVIFVFVTCLGAANLR
jgi:hypothetical protein